MANSSSLLYIDGCGYPEHCKSLLQYWPNRIEACGVFIARAGSCSSPDEIKLWHWDDVTNIPERCKIIASHGRSGSLMTTISGTALSCSGWLCSYATILLDLGRMNIEAIAFEGYALQACQALMNSPFSSASQKTRCTCARCSRCPGCVQSPPNNHVLTSVLDRN